jgi:hypothetical protein
MIGTSVTKDCLQYQLQTQFKKCVLIAEMCQECYLLESAERSQDRPPNPDTVLALRWSNHLNFHAAGRKSSDLLAHTVSNAREHCRTTTEHDVAIQVLPDIHIALHDGVVSRLMDSRGFHTNHGWLEEDLRAPKPLCTNGNHLAIRQLIALLNRRAVLGSLQLLLIVKCNVCELLLDVPHDFPLSAEVVNE